MIPFRSGPVLCQINRLIDTHAPENLSDRDLLECFIGRRDEAAFATLLRRHGPMVMRVCRRVLGDWHAAEDAFQATFLVLARQAATIRRREGVGGWLHGVAFRLALKARRRARRPVPDGAPRSTPPDPLDKLTMQEAQTVLDEELRQLPPKYREPLLLCYLEEKTRDEAARQLGWPLGTLKSRVERGRELLRVGLERRGLTLSAGLVATGLASRSAGAALSAEVVRQTAQAAVQVANGPLQAVAGISPEAVSLAKGVLPMITLTHVKWAAVALLALVLVGKGWGLVFPPTPRTPETPQGEARPAAADEKKPAPAKKIAAGKDIHGDPLPPDSLTRLGTIRWRQEDDVAFLTYLPDGKHLLTRGRNGLFHLWDRQTGQVVRRFGKAHQEDAGKAKPTTKDNTERMMMMSLGGSSEEAFVWPGAVALAPDGRCLAAAEPDGAIAVWDVGTGKELHHWKASGSGLLQMVPGVGANHVTELLFAPDGRRLAAKVADGSLQVWDVAEGRMLRKLQGNSLLGGLVNRYMRPGFKDSLAFTADGKVLATAQPGFGLQKNAQPELTLTVNRWDIATGKEVAPPKKFSDLALFGAFAPDGKTLAVASLQGNLTLWDVAEDKEVRRLNLGGGVVEFTSQLTFSPDGRLLAVKRGGRPIGLWDVASGQELRHFGDGGEQGMMMGLFRSTFDLVGSRLVFAPDGSRLAVSEHGRTIRQWDVANGKDLDGFAGHHSPVEAVGLAANGRTLWSRSSDGQMIQWDVRGKIVQQLPGAATQGAVSADGRTLLLGFSDGTLVVHDAQTGQEVRRWKAHVPLNIGGGILSIPPLLAVALAPDGKTAASWGSDQTIRLWDVATGRKFQEVPGKLLATEGLPAEIAGLVASALTSFIPSTRLIFSPDGATIAVLPPQFVGLAAMVSTFQRQLGTPTKKRSDAADKPGIILWDIATGQPLRRFAAAPDGILTGAFAPDGRTLATGQMDGTILLWETVSGKQRGKLQANERSAVRVLCYGTDGRTLISAGHDGSIHFWDPFLGEERRKLTGHRGGILSLALAANGKTLISGSEDTTALVWPMPALAAATVAAETLDERQRDERWKDLAEADAEKAFQAIRTLSEAPASAAWLGERLRPAPGPDADTLKRCVTELDSDQFEVRKRAEEELQKLGHLAHPALRRALADGPSLQVQQRIERLLEKQVTGQAPTGDELRALRAVEVLERLGTAEARHVLAQLAQGAEGAALTREARAAGQRLGR